MTWLDRVCALDIRRWAYKPALDPMQREHIGPMAEDWRDKTGIGDGISIDTVDAVGILLKCVQELRAEIVELKSQVKVFTDASHSAHARNAADHAARRGSSASGPVQPPGPRDTAGY